MQNSIFPAASDFRASPAVRLNRILMLGVALPASFLLPAMALADTIVGPGTQTVTNQSDLGATHETTTVQDGGTLAISGDVSVQQSLYRLSGTGDGDVGAINSTGNNALTGDIRFDDTTKIISESGVLVLDGAMSGAILPAMEVTFGGNG